VTDAPPQLMGALSCCRLLVPGGLYVLGGSTFCNTVLRLDLASYTWDVAAPMDKPCVHAGVASLDGFLFACGGRTGSR
jgi:hypothetical protein